MISKRLPRASTPASKRKTTKTTATTKTTRATLATRTRTRRKKRTRTRPRRDGRGDGDVRGLRRYRRGAGRRDAGRAAHLAHHSRRGGRHQRRQDRDFQHVSVARFARADLDGAALPTAGANAARALQRISVQ